MADVVDSGLTLAASGYSMAETISDWSVVLIALLCIPLLGLPVVAIFQVVLSDWRQERERRKMRREKRDE